MRQLVLEFHFEISFFKKLHKSCVVICFIGIDFYHHQVYSENILLSGMITARGQRALFVLTLTQSLTRSARHWEKLLWFSDLVTEK
jgi:hypothetical protein